MTVAVSDTAAELRETLLAALDETLGGAPVCDFVDYPDHFNCGDAAIYAGQRAALAQLGVAVAGVFDRSGFRPRALRADGPILFQGGGNLGGLYPTHHALKLKVLRAFPGRRVIQLPQSLEYGAPERRDELRRAVAEHGNVVLLLRDRRSFDIAQRDFDCEVRLVPDMAFALGPIRRRRATVPLAVLSRTDREAPAGARLLDGLVFDWLEPRATEPVRLAHGLYRGASRVAARMDRRSAHIAVRTAGDLLARMNVRRGARMLCAGEVLVTDRLHGHILACLIGLPHVVVNDRYGKIEATYRTWTERFPGAAFSPTWSDVDRALADVVGA